MEDKNTFQYYKKIQEVERNRIARELHDTSLQTLTHLTHQIELAGLYLDSDIVQTKLELAEINNQLRKTIDDIRETIYNLRPMMFDDLGLKETIEKYLTDMDGKSEIKISYSIDQIDCDNNELLFDLYRIVQECVMNSIKHSNAKNLYVDFKDNLCKIRIKIQDDGIGFNLEDAEKENHFGINILNERVEIWNGKCNIETQPGNGVTMIIEIPKIMTDICGGENEH